MKRDADKLRGSESYKMCKNTVRGLHFLQYFCIFTFAHMLQAIYLEVQCKTSLDKIYYIRAVVASKATNAGLRM